MTHIIDLSPEIEASLQEAAAKQQQTPEEYLRAAVEGLLRPMERKGPSWSEAAGMFSYPLVGEDAQAWVTRTRHEGDEHRERLLRRQGEPVTSQEEL